MMEPDFQKKKKKFRPKVLEICRKNLFFGIFSRFHFIFCCFFHTKTLVILTIPTIKHGSIVNKTDFWSRNFLNIAGTVYFPRKNDLSRAVIYIFSWNFAHWCKMALSEMWQRLIFDKHTFPAKNAGKMPEKPVVCAFSWDFIIFFFKFFAQACVLAMPNIWTSAIIIAIPNIF